MIQDLNKFKLDLRNFHQKVVPEKHRGICIKIAQTLYDKLTAVSGGTPVDTGYTVANWGVKIGQAGVPTAPVGKYPEEARGLYTRPIDLRAYFPDIEGVLATAGLAPFIWVYNNAPAIVPLEEGHSVTQAPTGMMLNALNDVQAYVNSL